MSTNIYLFKYITIVITIKFQKVIIKIKYATQRKTHSTQL